MKAPDNCPICDERDGWKLIDATKKGFNAGKAVVGGAIFGIIGLAAGFSGKKKALYQCIKCGFSHEYDDVADKEKTNAQIAKQNKFVNKGVNAVYIEVVTRATPHCPFCGKPQELYIRLDKGVSPYHFLCGHCNAEYRCDFTFGGKVKAESTQIIDCGTVNKDGLSVGKCDVKVLIKDDKRIKL